MMIFSVLALSLLSVFGHAAEPPAGSAYYGVNSDYAMPLIEIKRIQNTQTLDSGILKDLGIALFKEMRVKPIIVLLPKSRVAPALVSGNVNVLCHLNEIWQESVKDELYWSEPVYRSSNVIAYIGNKAPKRIKDLYGARVGTVLNFVYRELDPHFKAAQIIREDGPNNENNLQKLLNGRLSYVVMSNIEFDYYKKIYAPLESADIEMDAVETKCALSKKNTRITLEQLNKAIDAIKKNGTLEKILKTYQ